MASVKQGTRTASGEWWKHLSFMKRPYWKGERQAVKRDIAAEIAEEALKLDGKHCTCAECLRHSKYASDEE